MKTDSERASWRVALALCALLCLPYVLMAQGFFYSDDWVHLHFNRSIPPWQVWRYFSPRVIWFYRPVQAMQFGWLYHLVGFRPLAYNLSLLLMHFGVCVLVYRLVALLTTHRMALLTTALFGSQWVYASMLTWRSNFSTLQWALVTLGMAILFLRYLETRERRALVGTYALLVASFFIKESAMNAPLLLGALWWWQRRRVTDAPAAPMPLSDGARVLGPAVLLVLVYVGLHKLCVRDLYDGYVVPGYHFVGVSNAIQQTLFSLNYLILSFAKEPLSLAGLVSLQRGLVFLSAHGYLLLLALAAVAWRWRDAQVAFGFGWACAAMLPTVAMTGFHADRFYYLPTVGSALIVARGVQLCWRRARGVRLTRSVAVIAMGFLVAANVTVIVRTGLNSQENARRQAAAFAALQAQRGRLPGGSLVILKHVNDTTGFGIVEMVRMALDDRTAMGVIEGQRMPDRWARRLDRIPSAYVLDCGQQPPRMWCMRGQQLAAGPAPDRPGSAASLLGDETAEKRRTDAEKTPPTNAQARR